MDTTFLLLHFEWREEMNIDSSEIFIRKRFIYLYRNFFCELGVACWPLVPKFAGSNPAEAVGFFRAENPQLAFLRRGNKAVGPMS